MKQMLGMPAYGLLACCKGCCATDRGSVAHRQLTNSPRGSASTAKPRLQVADKLGEDYATLPRALELLRWIFCDIISGHYVCLLYGASYPARSPGIAKLGEMRIACDQYFAEDDTKMHCLCTSTGADKGTGGQGWATIFLRPPCPSS